MPRLGTDRPLVALAWVNVILHIFALVLAAIGMRPGSPLVPLDERLAYLAAVPIGWTAGWSTWMVCAIALIAFLAVMTTRLSEHARLAQLALIIAVVGLGFDLFCDSIYLLVFPELASRESALFLIVERITGIGSLIIANGAYSVSILLITLALRDRQRRSRGVIGTGYAVAVFGLLLSAAGFTGVPWHAQWATLPTIGFFCVWTVLAAYSLEPAAEVS
jgi:hypothetical protein